MTLLPYFLLGSAFGFVMVEAEVVSWFRIQEMFRFDAFHMYGIIGTAVLTAAISLLTIKRLGVRGPDGEPLGFTPKVLGTGARYLAGGTVFGLGWALTGACPGPLRRAGRRGHTCDARRVSERARRHVDVRQTAAKTSALNDAVVRDGSTRIQSPSSRTTTE